MNNYPSWWNTTITVYNRYEDVQTHVVRWYRHVISNCFWKYTGNKVTIDKVVLETNTTICRIPKQPNFMEKYQWIGIPNDEMSDYLTLSPEDIIIKGEVADIIDEYTPGKRSSDILIKYKALQGCIEVQEVAINTGGGRGSEHYYVRGV